MLLGKISITTWGINLSSSSGPSFSFFYLLSNRRKIIFRCLPVSTSYIHKANKHKLENAILFFPLANRNIGLGLKNKTKPNQQNLQQQFPKTPKQELQRTKKKKTKKSQDPNPVTALLEASRQFVILHSQFLAQLQQSSVEMNHRKVAFFTPFHTLNNRQHYMVFMLRHSSGVFSYSQSIKMQSRLLNSRMYYRYFVCTWFQTTTTCAFATEQLRIICAIFNLTWFLILG